MVIDGVVGIPILFLVLMVLVYGKILVWDDLPYFVSFCMILVMGFGEDGLWREVGEVDEVLYFYS